MSTASHVDGTGVTSVAERLTDADFVRLCPIADGDALCATGLLARALGTADVAFQANVSRLGVERTPATEADLTVRVGTESPTPPSATPTTASTETDDVASGEGVLAIDGEPRPASVEAFAIAEELGCDPDPVLALAGVVVASIRDARDPTDDALADAVERFRELARDRGTLERRPGIAAPTADVVDGLAHTTLAHAPFSGETEAVSERWGTLVDREDAGREIASLLALATVGAEDAPPRAARTIERALRPDVLHPPVPFATVGGLADVLCAVATDAPGTALALVLGYDVREAALEAWRAHSRRAHGTLGNATIARYGGLCVARIEDAVDADREAAAVADRGDPDASDRPSVPVPVPVSTVVRLLRDFRSPEPVALVVGEREAAVAAVEDRDLGTVASDIAAAHGGHGGGTERYGELRFADRTPERLLKGVREALR